MKLPKTLGVLLTAVFTVLGCTDNFMNGVNEENMEVFSMQSMSEPLPPPTPPANLTELFRGVLNRSVHGFDRYIGTYGGQYVYLNFEKALRDEANILAPYFGMPNFNYSVFHDVTLSGAPFGTRTLPSQVPGASTFLESKMLYFLDRYFDTMYDATNLIEVNLKYQNITDEINTHIQMGQGQVEGYVYNWGPEHIESLLAVIKLAHMFAQDYFKGKVVPVILGDVNNALVTSSAGGCVNFKTAWQAAVLGGFLGGAIGGYIGATGGTVVLPFFGAITGGIGGFVYGFANGFVTGAAMSIAQDVIFKCLLKATRQTSGDERCEDFDFYANHPEWCDEYYRDRVYWWYLIVQG